jgi:hypothetical protein
MRDLIAKFPDGYEGWAKERGEELAPSPSSSSFTEITAYNDNDDDNDDNSDLRPEGS